MQQEKKSLGWGRKRSWTKDMILQQKRYPIIWQLIANEQVLTTKNNDTTDAERTTCFAYYEEKR